VRLTGCDLILDGEAHVVDDPDVLEAVAARYRDGGRAWFLYRFVFTAPSGCPRSSPFGAMWWRSERG
jgi:hypothetical protein